MATRKKAVKQAVAESVQAEKEKDTASVVKRDVAPAEAPKKKGRKYAEPKDAKEPTTVDELHPRVQNVVKQTGKMPIENVAKANVNLSAAQGRSYRQRSAEQSAVPSERVVRPTRTPDERADALAGNENVSTIDKVNLLSKSEIDPEKKKKLIAKTIIQGVNDGSLKKALLRKRK